MYDIRVNLGETKGVVTVHMCALWCYLIYFFFICDESPEFLFLQMEVYRVKFTLNDYSSLRLTMHVDKLGLKKRNLLWL